MSGEHRYSALDSHAAASAPPAPPALDRLRDLIASPWSAARSRRTLVVVAVSIGSLFIIAAVLHGGRAQDFAAGFAARRGRHGAGRAYDGMLEATLRHGEPQTELKEQLGDATFLTGMLFGGCVPSLPSSPSLNPSTRRALSLAKLTLIRSTGSRTSSSP